MARALVVCPATEELVLIEYVDTPLGALLHACSRFSPATALTCVRACARHQRYEMCDATIEVDEAGADTELEIAAVHDPIEVTSAEAASVDDAGDDANDPRFDDG